MSFNSQIFYFAKTQNINTPQQASEREQWEWIKSTQKFQFIRINKFPFNMINILILCSFHLNFHMLKMFDFGFYFGVYSIEMKIERSLSAFQFIY